MLACRDAERQLCLGLKESSSRRGTARDARNTKQCHKGCVRVPSSGQVSGATIRPRPCSSRGQPMLDKHMRLGCVSGSNEQIRCRDRKEVEERVEGGGEGDADMRDAVEGDGTVGRGGLGWTAQQSRGWSWSTKRDSSGVASMAEDGWIMDDGEQRRLGKMEARGGGGQGLAHRPGYLGRGSGWMPMDRGQKLGVKYLFPRVLAAGWVGGVTGHLPRELKAQRCADC